MVAAFVQLDHGLALVTALPTLFFCLSKEFVDGIVFWTVESLVPPVAAPCADLGITVRAACILAPVALSLDLRRSDEMSTSSGRTIQPVLSGILCEFGIPISLEMVVKEPLSMPDLDGVLSAAFWRHMCSIFDRQGESSLDAGIAHPVTTFEMSGFFGRYVAHTYNTLDAVFGISLKSHKCEGRM